MGHFNYKFFYLFLFWLWLGCLFILITALPHVFSRLPPELRPYEVGPPSHLALLSPFD